MGFDFLNIFSAIRARRLRDALECYERAPGVSETARVVRLLLKDGDYNQAFVYSDNGSQRFPESEELMALRQRAMKFLALEECRELDTRMNRSPRPETAAKIIEIRRSLNDFRACEKIARRWGKRFPDSWILLFAVAKYLFQRSLVEQDPKISTRCLNYLEQAAALAPENYKTLLYLATLLHQLGKKSQALHVAEKLTTLFPKDQRARSLSACIRRARGESEALAKESKSDVDDSRESLLATLKDSPSVHGVHVQVPRAPDAEGEPRQASHFRESDVFQFDRGEEILGNLIHSLKTASQRIGIGDLESAVVVGASWNMYYLDAGDEESLFCTTKEFKEDQFAQLAARFAPINEAV